MHIALDDPDFFLGDVEPVYRWLRANDPVHHCGGDLWAVTRYADIMAISRDPATFCSSRGVVINDPLRIVGELPTPPSIIHMDPPGHNRYRRVVSRAFAPRMTATLEPRIRQLARETLDAAPQDGEFDFVEQVAIPLPILVIAEMLGVPASDRATFRRWSDAMIQGADIMNSPDVLTTMAELFGYFHAMVAERRTAPRDDLLSALAVGEVDGDRLTDDEIGMFCMTLLVAGNETTRNLIAGGMRALIEHPDQMRTLRADPSLVPGAIEEMLRWVSPVRAFARTATRATEIRGTAVPEGAYLVLLYASGNRDEEVFGPTAGEFHVDRPTEPAHLAFGFGQHLCMGASLARLEARIMFDDMLARWRHIELAGPVEKFPSTVMNGLARMPVRTRA